MYLCASVSAAGPVRAGKHTAGGGGRVLRLGAEETTKRRRPNLMHTPGSCRAHSPALHVGRRDRVASCSWPCASHPHAHLLICIYAVLTAKPGQDSVQLHTGRRRGQCRTMRPRALRRAGRRPRTTSDVPTGGTLPCAVAIRSPQSEVRCSLCVGHFTADGRDHLGEAPGTSYDS